MTVRVASGARLHVGFCNLSLTHERLYGSLGLALEAPRVVVEADRADGVTCDDDLGCEYARRACDLLDVPGAAVTVRERLPRHVGLGSGTQLALAVLTAVAASHDRAARARERAPALGRGGRSGVGVAGFEAGGFVLDAGHPTERFTTDRPETGTWTVPPTVARHDVPESWRFVVVCPDAAAGRSDAAEDASMRSVVERADPTLADRVSGTVLREVLPAVVEGDVEAFGAGVTRVGRLNGAWYADEQGGVYRPPVGTIVAALDASPAVTGVGQSSWGPAVYAVTDAAHAEEAAAAARDALDDADVGGDVLVTAGRNEGASITRNA